MGRPLRTFHDFIGQRRVVGHLERLIKGALARGEPIVPLLLLARSGFGKTAMAKAIAIAYGTKLHSLFASSCIQPSHICGVLRELRHGDVFFIDEAHSLGRDAQQLLYVAMDEQRIPAIAHRDDKLPQSESIAQFTLVLATNEPGVLKAAFTRRLETLQFDPYSIAELKAIGEREALDRGLVLSPQAAGLLATVAQGSPGRLARLVQTLSHFWHDRSELGTDEMRRFLLSEGIDEHGLTPIQRQYLWTLAAAPQGRCGLETLAVKLGLDSRFVRLDVEIYLVDQELVGISARSRVITAQGRQLANELEKLNRTENSNDSFTCR